MSKRKVHDLYHVVLPVPKWPRWDEPERWTENDLESAVMINTLNLEAHDKSRWYSDPKQSFIKVSRFIQALDLVHFDDYDIVLDADLESPPRASNLSMA